MFSKIIFKNQIGTRRFIHPFKIPSVCFESDKMLSTNLFGDYYISSCLS